jgi:hypothetical protein
LGEFPIQNAKGMPQPEGRMKIARRFNGGERTPIHDLFHCRTPASETPKPGGRMRIARCFNSGKGEKKEKSPQGTTEISYIFTSFQDQSLLLTGKAIYGPILAGWNKRFSRPLTGTRLIYSIFSRP